jgi:competence protein ComEA
MKHAASFSLLLAGSALVASTFLAAAPARQDAAPAAAPAQAGSATPDPALTDKDYGVFNDTCGACHDSERIVSRRRSKAEWQDLIGQMIDKGAIGDEKSFQTIFEYVRRYYGKVSINSATADEITITLGLSDKDAQAILDYKKANGNFADYAALAKVPGIDTKTLEAHKDALDFQ